MSPYKRHGALVSDDRGRIGGLQMDESRQRKPMSRRAVLRLAAGVTGATALSSILAACGEPPGNTTGGAATSAAGGGAATNAAGGAATSAAGGGATAAANVSNAPTPTPQPLQVFGSETAKVKLRY